MTLLIEKPRIISIIITIIIAAEIFYFSSLPSIAIENPVEGINLAKMYHLTIFFILAFFLTASIKGSKRIKPKHIILTILISLIYAIIDEVHQIYVPGRFPSINDVLIDLIGILLAILIYPKKYKTPTKK